MDTVVIRRNPSRTLTAIEPFYHPMSLLEEIEDFANSAWERTGYGPEIDLYEDKDELVMKVDLPGVIKDNIDIKFDDGYLTVKAERKPEEVSKDADYLVCERSFGKYSRSVSLPHNVDVNKISSTFENGVLEIKLPKTSGARKRHIEIKGK